MVDFMQRAQPSTAQISQQFRTKREKWLARMRASNTGPDMVRCDPKNDLMREIFKHPNGTVFRGFGAIELPNDVFTQRRLRDGDIVLAKDQRQEPRA
ncbi:MAG: hypothetical protein WCB99_03800 [Candidatus Cybelea sp.]